MLSNTIESKLAPTIRLNNGYEMPVSHRLFVQNIQANQSISIFFFFVKIYQIIGLGTYKV